MSVKIAVTIAGSDSGGGAGIQADLKTFSANGVYGASVITALTAQNTLGVTAIEDVSADFITKQIDAVFSDLDVSAVKIGMLSKIEVIEAVADGLKRHDAKNIVLDPVMVAASGDPLINNDAVDAIRKILMPLSNLVTPNMHEAARLTSIRVSDEKAEIEAQAKALLSTGCGGILLKGGHGEGRESSDYLITPERAKWYSTARIETKNSHGTGCSLSSAIASNLANGQDMFTAVENAKIWLTGAIAAANDLHIGSGSGPVHHFYKVWG